MFKNIQTKIVFVFAILGIIVITVLGIFFLNELNQINQTVGGLNEQIVKVKNGICLAIIIFILGTLLGSIFVSKVIFRPISKLIKSVEEISREKQRNIKLLGDGKNRSELDDLVDAFGFMNFELKENLNEVTRQKKQIEAILLHMTDGIIAFNIDGDIIHINHAAKELLNLKEEKNFESVFQKFDVDVNLEKIIYLENWTSSELKINVDDKTINLFFASFKNENDRPAGIIVVIQDITEHVKLDSMRKEFVADVSHELKTPITSILGYADTLIESDVKEEMRQEFLKRISSEANRMADLVSDLLTLSRYDNSKVNVGKTEFDLGELAKNSFDRLSLELEKKNQDAECLITADVPLVYADKKGIERVILNILSNAIKYTPEGGTIKVYVGFVYNDAYIKIIDTGIGIPKDDLDKVFERFYRVDKSRTREMGGTGLGLPIAKEILEQNGGSIDIKSEVGKGTEVVIRIPTKQALDKNLKNTTEKNRKEDE